MVDPSVPLCATCSKPLPPKPQRGPSKMYCDVNCRMKASRRRKVKQPSPEVRSAEPRPGIVTPAVLRPAVPVPSRQQREQALAKSLTQLAGPDEGNMGVAQTISDLKALTFRFERLGAEARPEWAWRCSQLAIDLSTALHRSFGDL